MQPRPPARGNSVPNPRSKYCLGMIEVAQEGDRCKVVAEERDSRRRLKGWGLRPLQFEGTGHIRCEENNGRIHYRIQEAIEWGRLGLGVEVAWKGAALSSHETVDNNAIQDKEATERRQLAASHNIELVQVYARSFLSRRDLFCSLATSEQLQRASLSNSRLAGFALLFHEHLCAAHAASRRSLLATVLSTLHREDRFCLIDVFSRFSRVIVGDFLSTLHSMYCDRYSTFCDAYRLACGHEIASHAAREHIEGLWLCGWDSLLSCCRLQERHLQHTADIVQSEIVEWIGLAKGFINGWVAQERERVAVREAQERCSVVSESCEELKPVMLVGFVVTAWCVSLEEGQQRISQTEMKHFTSEIAIPHTTFMKQAVVDQATAQSSLLVGNPEQLNRTAIEEAFSRGTIMATRHVAALLFTGTLETLNRRLKEFAEQKVLFLKGAEPAKRKGCVLEESMLRRRIYSDVEVDKKDVIRRTLARVATARREQLYVQENEIRKVLVRFETRSKEDTTGRLEVVGQEGALRVVTMNEEQQTRLELQEVEDTAWLPSAIKHFNKIHEVSRCGLKDSEYTDFKRIRYLWSTTWRGIVDKSTHFIQAVWRIHRAKRLKSQLLNNRMELVNLAEASQARLYSAHLIQKVWRGHYCRCVLATDLFDAEEA